MRKIELEMVLAIASANAVLNYKGKDHVANLDRIRAHEKLILEAWETKYGKGKDSSCSSEGN